MKNNLLLIAATVSIIVIGNSQASLAQATFKASTRVSQNLGLTFKNIVQHANKRNFSSVSPEAKKIVSTSHKIEPTVASHGSQDAIKNEIDQITLRLLQDKERSMHDRREIAAGLAVAAVNTVGFAVGWFGAVLAGGIIIGAPIVAYDIYTYNRKPSKGDGRGGCPFQ